MTWEEEINEQSVGFTMERADLSPDCALTARGYIEHILNICNV